MPNVAFDHIAIHVADVPTSEKFYRELFELESLPRPDFPFPGAWLKLDPHYELHLIGERTEPVQSHSRGTHFALTTNDIMGWKARLEEYGAEFVGPRTRPDNYKQIFVIDPDGHYVEINQPPSAD